MKSLFFSVLILTLGVQIGTTARVWAQDAANSTPTIIVTNSTTPTVHKNKKKKSKAVTPTVTGTATVSVTETPTETKTTNITTTPTITPLMGLKKDLTIPGPVTITGQSGSKTVNLVAARVIIPKSASITSWTQPSPENSPAPGKSNKSGGKTKVLTPTPVETKTATITSSATVTATTTSATDNNPVTTSSAVTIEDQIPINMPVKIQCDSGIIEVTNVIAVNLISQPKTVVTKPVSSASTGSTAPDYSTQHFFIELGYVSFAPYALNAPSSQSMNYTLTSNSQVSSLISASVRFRDVKSWNLQTPGNQEDVTHEFSDISMLNFGVAVSGQSPTSIQASNAVNAGNIYGEIYESLDFVTDFVMNVLTVGLASKQALSNFSDRDENKGQLNAEKSALADTSTLPFTWDLGFYYAFNSNRSSLNLLHQIAFGPLGATSIPNGKNPPIELVGGAMLGWSEFPSFIPNSPDNEVSTANGFPSFGLVHSFLAFISFDLPVGGNYITLDAETATAFDSSFNTWSLSLGYTVPLGKILTDLIGSGK